MIEAGQPLIQIQDLTKVFYTDEIETHALSGIHLSVAKGEYVAMSGPSGCGKSTLLSIIGLLDTPTAGTLLAEWEDGREPRFRRAVAHPESGDWFHFSKFQSDRRFDGL
jgi:ABC-type lipoprotein export system ATPase subunit